MQAEAAARKAAKEAARRAAMASKPKNVKKTRKAS
jgi:hypothetical protein